MSPLFMPKHLLHPMIDEVQEKLKNEKRNVFNLAFFEGLNDLKSHPTNEERWPATYKKGLKIGKEECERLDKIRGTDIKKILAKNPKVLEWWTNI